MALENNQTVVEATPTEIFLPEYHFARNATNIEVSGGKWSLDIDEVGDGTLQRLRWWHGTGEQSITVKGVTRKQGAESEYEEEVGYFEQYRRSFCTVM
jgi:Glycoside hydrolase family 5 C-terminal domain